MRSVTARQGSQSLSRAKAPSRTQKSASFRLDAGFFFGILATCNNRAAPIGKQLASTSARANSSTFSVLDASSCSSCLSCARSPQQIHNQACVPAQSPSMRLGSGPCDFHQCIWMRGMAQETGNRSLMGDSVVASRASPPSPVVPGCRNGNGERWTDDYPTNSFLHVVDPQPHPSCRPCRCLVRLADRTDRTEVPAASISNCASWTPAADPPVRVAVAVGDMGLGWVCLPEKVQVRTCDTSDARMQPDLGRVQPRLSASSSLNATWTYCGLNSG